MAIEERRRSELYEGLAAVLGPEVTATMFELLPSPERELATRADLQAFDGRFTQIDRRFAEIDHRFAEIDHRFAEIDHRFAEIDHRFELVDARFDHVDERFDHLEQRLDDRIDGLRNELLAAFRGELVAAVSGQTRAVIVATATATFGIGGLAVTLAQLL
jgi:chromosome segregation ATPase